MRRAPSSVFDISFSQYTCRPAFEAVDGVRRVPEVGRRDDDRVEVLLLVEHLLVVFVSVGVMLVLAEQVDGSLLVVLRPDVAHGPEPEARDPEHRVEQHLSLGAGPEQRDVDLGDVLRGGGRLAPASPLAVSARTDAAFARRRRRGPGPGRSRGPAARRADRGPSRPPSPRRACRRRPSALLVFRSHASTYFAGRPKTSTST